MVRTLKMPPVWVGLYLYWIVLLLWQNVRSVGNRSGSDVLIKVVLIVMLLVIFLANSKTINVFSAALVFLYTVATLLQIVLVGGSFETTEIVYFFYPIFLCFCVYGFTNSLGMNKKQLYAFANCIIITVWYIVLYALIFCTDQFTGAFALTTAYGNELSSFLVSSYEYGLYLAYGIILAVLCIEFMPLTPKKRNFYILTIVVFLVNLILTFSRTSIIACALMLTVYILFAKKGRIRNVILFLVFLAVALYCLSGTIHTFVDQIVFKGNENSGRSELARLALSLFKDLSFSEKVFGMNYGQYVDSVERITSHTNVHNAYLQILLTMGIKGLIFLAAIVLSALTLCKRTLRRTNSIKIKNVVTIMLGSVMGSLIFMVTTTSALFASSIDAYFLTLCAVIVPKYVCNAISTNSFETEEITALS